MAYSPRPDGLNDLFLDDGTRVVSPLPAEQLEQMGHTFAGGMPMPRGPGMSPDAVAGPGGGPRNTIFGIDTDNPVNSLLGLDRARPVPAGMPTAAEISKARGPSLSNMTLGTAPGSPGGLGAAAVYAPPPAPPAAEEEPPPEKANPSKLVPLGQGLGSYGMQQPPGYAPQRVHKIQGGDVRASYTRVPGQAVSDDVKADAINRIPEENELSAENIYNQREELRLKQESQLLEQQKRLEQQQSQREHVNRTLAAKQSVIDQRDREIEKMHPQGAREVFQNKSFAGQLSAVLTMMMGGYLQGMQGSQQNSGYSMVRDAIMDEIASQRSDFEDAKDKGELARNDFAQAVAIYGTPEAAALDMEMRQIGLAEKSLANRASKVTNQEYLQAANQAAAELRQQRAEVKLKLSQLEKGFVQQENYQNVPDRYITTGGAPKVNKEDEARKVRLPDGSYMYARDATQMRKLQDVVKANALLAGHAGRLKALTDTIGKREPTSAERAAAETIKQDMMFTYKDASQAGALDKGLQDAMETYFGKPEDMLRIKDAGRKLDEVRRIATGKIHAVVRYDLHPDANYSPGVPMPPPGESDE